MREKSCNVHTGQVIGTGSGGNGGGGGGNGGGGGGNGGGGGEDPVTIEFRLLRSGTDSAIQSAETAVAVTKVAGTVTTSGSVK